MSIRDCLARYAEGLCKLQGILAQLSNRNVCYPCSMASQAAAMLVSAGWVGGWVNRRVGEAVEWVECVSGLSG